MNLGAPDLNNGKNYLGFQDIGVKARYLIIQISFSQFPSFATKAEEKVFPLNYMIHPEIFGEPLASQEGGQ